MKNSVASFCSEKSSAQDPFLELEFLLKWPLFGTIIGWLCCRLLDSIIHIASALGCSLRNSFAM
jgi:hypothetical protein